MHRRKPLTSGSGQTEKAGRSACQFQQPQVRRRKNTGANLPPARLPNACMALVPGAGSVTDGDLYRFLRRRLRVFCTMLASLFFAMASLSLVFSLAGFHPDGSVDLTEWLRRYWKLLLLTISLSASAALLLAKTAADGRRDSHY